jgi:crotonobetainyl-CoA:carnitine CoA-transferase CaiB-like acyl-CoA transferase
VGDQDDPMTSGQTAGPLSGVRVLELAGSAGHYCGKLLGDMGADVVKVEPPGGDQSRRVGPFAADLPGPDRSLPFWYYNTSKRGVTLDIARPAGRELFARLVQSADVLIEDFEPGMLDRLGFSYSQLQTLRSDLIVASITPFGQTGPWRGLRGSDLVNLALGGTMAMNGYDDRPGSPPIRPGGGHSYLMASEYGFMAIMLALLERDASGLGQWIDVSIHEACAATTEGAFANWEYFGRVVHRQTGRHAQATPTTPWQHLAADGRYVNLMGGGIPRISSSWRPLVQWMSRLGKAEDLGDPRFEAVVHRSPAQRNDPDSLHVLDVIARFVKGIPSEDTYREGQSYRLPWGIVRSPEENMADPHWRDRDFFVSVDDPATGTAVTYPGAPYKFSRTPWKLSRRAPLIGQHNVEIYQGELGLDREQLRELFEQGII